MDAAVSFQGVCKRFSRGRRMRTLAETVFSWPRRLLQRRSAEGLLEHEFWALNDVSFEIGHGEMLGVIGPNGSGKSTLLKLLYRILRPEKGSVRLAGRVCGLIELGAGFHPYLTGRENVFINGAILGMSAREIRSKYDSIVEFSGVGEFMDMQVKNYSNGMYARLAFSVAAHASPDVLLVDEVLAVGDIAFQMKCFDWMAQQRKRGTTVVCVSHNMHHVGAASKCLYLKEGRVEKLGNPGDVISAYLADAESGPSMARGVSFVPTAQGEPRAEITKLEILDRNGSPAAAIEYDENLRVRFHYVLRESLAHPVVALAIYAEDPRFLVQTPGNFLVYLHSGKLLEGRGQVGSGVVEVDVLQVRLPPGRHRMAAYVLDGSLTNPIWYSERAAELEARRPEWSDQIGLIDHKLKWRIPELQATAK